MQNHFQKGQTTTEYTVALVAVFMLFFIGDPNLIQQLTNAIHEFYANYSYAISLP